MKLAKLKLFTQNRYTHLLTILLTFYLSFPFFRKIETEFPFLSVVFLVAIMFTLRALNISRRAFFTCFSVGVISLLGEIILGFGAAEMMKGKLAVVTSVIYALFLIIAIVLMIRKMFEATKVTNDTIIGGISIYILIGFLWTIFYYIVYRLDNTAFSYLRAWHDSYLFYFSNVTLTTLGYGDIIPVNRFAMMLSSLEAMVGQLYLAVFVARLVGLHVINHQTSK